MAHNLIPFVKWLLEEFEPSARVNGQKGLYARSPGGDRNDLYGNSDMACVLYSLGALRPGPAEWRVWAKGFQDLQKPETGFFLADPPSHCAEHNTAFALGAMDLLGIRPLYPLHFAEQYDSPEKTRDWLASLDWEKEVYGGSHKGAGIASAFALVPENAPLSWFDWYFEELDARFDANNGMLGANKPEGGDLDQIGGTFHYAFLYEFFNRRMPFPERRIDSVLGLQQPDGGWTEKNPWWMTLDALYLLTRAARHAHYRVEDVRQAVERSAALCLRRCMDPEWRRRYFAGPLGVHFTTAAISIFAESQQFLGSHRIVTAYPLRLVLDKRPFI